VGGVRALAELGVIFLLFSIGLELSFERLWGMRRLVFGLGSAQILLSAVPIGILAGLFGNPLEVAVLLGACLALSSTAIVMQLLMEQGRFGSQVGRGSFAVLLAQDIAVVPVLFLVSALGASAGGSLVMALGGALAQAALAVVVILGIGRLVIRPLFRFVGATDSPELFLAVTLLTIIVTAAGTHAAGLSGALGAFLAGLLLAETEFRHEIAVTIEPVQGLLLGLFFMSIAMTIDPAAILADPLWIALSVVGLFAIKASITFGLARSFGFNLGQAAEMGLLLGQGGEFAFVVIGLALALGVVPADTSQFMLIVVGATMFLTPIVAHFARRLGEAIKARTQAPESGGPALEAGLSGHVIIVGYGRAGEMLASLLDRQRIRHVSLDLDADRAGALRARGVPIYLGDARRGAMLRKMGVRNAAALAICTDDPVATEQVLVAARRERADLTVVARSHDVTHSRELKALGAAEVVPELLESTLQLGQVLLEQLGLPANLAREVVDAQRAKASAAASGRDEGEAPSARSA
ncbi:MAG: cation:proton antiporter, partial [Steroidobacteraceae bacterium]